MTDYLPFFVVGNPYWSITLYWSNSRPFVPLWAYPKTGNRHGDGPRDDLVMTLASICARLPTPSDTYSADLDLSADAGLYPRHCCGRAIYRNGCAENQPGVIPLVRHLSYH